MKQGQRSREGRQGNVFALRLPPHQRVELEKLCAADNGPRHLGPWLVWKALQQQPVPVAPLSPVALSQFVFVDRPQPSLGDAAWLAECERIDRARTLALERWEDEGGTTAAPGTTSARGLESVIPAPAPRLGTTFPGAVIPGLAPSSGNTAPATQYPIEVDRWSGKPVVVCSGCKQRVLADYLETHVQSGWCPGNPPIAERLILDLCAGSGAWSEPYRAAGYPVRRVTLPADDVRTFIAPKGVWGVLAAPPCTEFSLAKNGHPRDFVEGMACVNACLRIVLSAQPRWWALENPVGLLGRWLGEPFDVFEPFDFGEPYSKRTALWGQFARPRRGPRVQAIDGGGPLCVECYPDNPRCCSLAEHRAITPAGFARAFFEANP